MNNKNKILAIGIFVSASAFMIYAIWSEITSIATRAFIALGYLTLLVVALLIGKIRVK